ncbi:YdhR family protein, partial [Escherichia coli]|nr:YdhR family protein [Escherichia coli]
MKLLQVDFEYLGPMGVEMSEALKELAVSINEEPGLIWKIWTESESEKLGGGI